MRNKILSLALTTVFSLSVSSVAFAGDYNKDKKMDKKNTTQSMNMQNRDKLISDSDVNPYYDPSIEGSGEALTFENNYDYIGVTSATGAGLLDEKKRQEAIDQERINQELKMEQDKMNKDVEDMDNINMQQNSTTGSGIVNDTIDAVDNTVDRAVDALDTSELNIIDRYNARISDCADELSRVNGELTKNEAFYACQRYKVN